MYRVHDPAIIIAIWSVWFQLSSERVSLGAWKRGKTNSLVSDDGYLQVSRKKKLRVQLVHEGDQKKCLFVMFLSYLSISYKNKTDDSWVYRTIRKYKWNRHTDIQQTSCHSNQSEQIEVHVYQNMLFFPQKGYWNVQVYKKTAATSKYFKIMPPAPPST